eukprot:1264376-Rhodomonas_salina.6
MSGVLGSSHEKSSVTVALARPAVATTPAVRLVISPSRHCKLVSETQPVAQLAVCPIPILLVTSRTAPKPVPNTPTTVTCSDEELRNRLLGAPALKAGRSHVIKLERVPTRSPAVTAAAKLDPTADLRLQATELVETQRELSHADPSTATAMESPARFA